MRLGGREGVLLGVLPFTASFAFLGGSGGRLACSSGGGSLLRVCVSAPPLVWLSDRLDTVDSWDISEEFEFLLTESVWVEGRRVGRLGGVASCLLRVGSAGGPGRPEGGCCWSPFSCPVVRRGRGGGSFSVAARTGRGGIEGLFSAETVSDVVLVTFSVKERTGGGGGGGRLPAVEGGAWKFFCWLRAAMRSASVLNCGTSASAIFVIVGGLDDLMLVVLSDEATLKSS